MATPVRRSKRIPRMINIVICPFFMDVDNAGLVFNTLWERGSS